jgi:hypothetical protein
MNATARVYETMVFVAEKTLLTVEAFFSKPETAAFMRETALFEPGTIFSASDTRCFATGTSVSPHRIVPSRVDASSVQAWFSRHSGPFNFGIEINLSHPG